MKKRQDLYRILCNSRIFPSAKAIRDEIFNLTGRKLFIVDSPEKTNRILLRWGNSETSSNIVADTDLNPRNLIQIAANKLSFSKRMQEADIPSPVYHSQQMPTIFPVLIRQTLHGFGGEGIVVCRDGNDFRHNWRNGFYWTPFMKVSSEFRVHCAGGKVLRVFKKLREEGMGEEEVPIRNLHRGYHFGLVENPLERMPNLKTFIEDLWNNLGIKTGFFAADVGWMSTAKKWMIFEINSAPGVTENENTCREYANYIVEALHL